MTNQDPRLFTLSLWQVQQGDDPRMTAWRGKLQSLPDGEAYYFRDWTVLIEHLETMLTARRELSNHQEVKG